MADSKVTALTALTALTGDETLYIVEDDDGTPVSRRITIEDFLTAIAARAELTAAFDAKILARLVYSASDKNDVTGTFADFDATNLAITFTAPPSGAVIVHLTSGSGSTASSSIWGLRESTTQRGNLQYIHGAVIQRGHARIYVSGLTPGNSYTYKWAGKNSGAGTSSLYTGGNGGIDGDSIMEVFAA
jgi:hypothetical protein